jgi:thiamine biosynthesis lipoprotein
VNWRAVDISAERVLLPKGFALSLNGIAQGYAADAVRSEMLALGIRDAMLDTGETAVLGQGPDRTPWRFGIEDVHQQAAVAAPVIVLPDGYAAATSSDAHTTFSADRVHHHILDPRTGDSPPHWSSVTVIARSAALADGLTKVFFMLPKEQVCGAARRWGVSVSLQDKHGQWLQAA